MKPALLILIGLLLGTGCVQASEELPFPSPSWFDSSKITRDPFTPIDTLDMDKTLVVESASSNGGKKFSLADLFRVSSISIGQLSIAIINNRAFAEGEAFDLRGEGKSVQRVTVLHIHDGSVDLNCWGKLVSVPLFRKEPKPLDER